MALNLDFSTELAAVAATAQVAKPKKVTVMLDDQLWRAAKLHTVSATATSKSMQDLLVESLRAKLQL